MTVGTDGPGFYDCVIPYLYLLEKLWVHCTSMLGLFFVSVFAQRAAPLRRVFLSSLLADRSGFASLARQELESGHRDISGKAGSQAVHSTCW